MVKLPPFLTSFMGNTALTAGAGAGKTSTLVEFYAGLITGRVDGPPELTPGRILAVTFTDKAAQEMRQRIRDRLGREEGRPDLIEELERAPISTIHAFCAAVLREFALEADLDPDFGVVAGDDLLARQAGAVVIQALAENDPDLNLLADRLGPGLTGPGALNSLIRLLRLTRTMGQSPDRLLAGLAAAARGLPRLKAGLERDLTAALAELGQVELKPGNKSTPRLKEIAAAVGQPIEAGLIGLIEAGTKGVMPQPVRPIRDKLKPLAENWRRLAAEPAGLEAAGALVRTLGRIEAAYGAAKQARGVLDYDDLQLLTRDLLYTNLPVRRRLKARLGMIMVDEFQDTSPVQWQIVRCLQEEIGQERLVGPDQTPDDVLSFDARKLLVVGDAKQSIYRFRGAEVEVFNQLMTDLRGEEAGGVQNLGRNYRSQPGLVEFFNRFFTVYLGPADQPFEAQHTEADCQVCGRADGLAQGCVEVIDTPDEGSAADKAQAEAAAIAWRIRDLVEGRGPDCLARADYGQMAILLRQGTHIDLFASALRRHRIPYQLVVEGGFLDQPEVVDLINLLDYLARPTDPARLVSVLRSPLVGLSDDSLSLMAIGGEIDRFAGILRQKTEVSLESGQARLVARFNALVDRLYADRDRLSAAELIELALEETDLAPVLLAGHQGRLRLANLQALIELARRPDSSGGSDLYSLLDRLRPADGRPPEGLDPPLTERAEAVRIMTIHKAKGLEFPVVFVAQAGRTRLGGRSEPVLMRPGLGLGVKIKNPDGDGWVETFSYFRLKEMERDREAAEHRRLLYVAATRARDLLVFSGPRPKESDRVSWRAAVERFVEEGGGGDLIRRLNGRTDWPEPIDDRPIALPGGNEPMAEADRAVAETVTARVTGPPRITPRLEMSVSALEDLAACPRFYYLRRVLGLQGQADGAVPLAGGLSALDAGLVFHRAVEWLDFQSPAEPGELIASAGAGLGLSLTPADIDRLAANLAGLINSGLGHRLAELDPRRLQRELPFSLAVAGAEARLTVRGVIDLLAESGDGPAIHDWKLARPGGGEEYAFQLGVYGLAVHRALAGIWPRLRVVYVDQGRVTEVELPFGPDQAARIEAQLADLADQLPVWRQSSDPADWPIQPGSQCRYCPQGPEEGGCVA